MRSENIRWEGVNMREGGDTSEEEERLIWEVKRWRGEEVEGGGGGGMYLVVVSFSLYRFSWSDSHDHDPY